MKTSRAMTATLVLVASAAVATPGKAQTSSCTTDTDCGRDMACRSDQCVCRWPLACNADAECGDGFLCQPATMTTCSGSSGGGTATRSPGDGTGAAAGGSSSGVGGGSGGTSTPVAVPPPADVASVDAGASAPPTCTSTPSYPGTCRPKVAACNRDADCPSPWTCVTAGLPVAVASPVALDAGVEVPLPPDVAVVTATATSTTTTTTTTGVGVCQSPCGRTYGGSDGTQGPGTVSLQADAGASKGTTPTVSPIVAPSNEGSGATGNSSDTPPPTAAKTGGSGCNVGSGAATGEAILVLALARAFALLGRKRQRR